MTRHVLCSAMAVAIFLLQGCSGHSEANPQPLIVEKVIALPNTKGRADHLALDLKHKRLFIAELGNGTIDFVDLEAGQVVRRIEGLNEPQGLAYLPGSNELVVSTGGDGVVRFYDATSLTINKALTDLPDADNIRVSASNGDILVGYGTGALAIIDATSHAVKVRMPLPSHPEGFQIAPDGTKVFVNLPRSASIAVIDLRTHAQVASWPAHKALENFPMAVDWSSMTVAAGFRLPGRFMTFDGKTGSVTSNMPACGSADDLFFDPKRQRFYMLCGDGHVDAFSLAGMSWKKAGQIATSPGGRTGLFSSELDQLFVVGSGASAARLWVLRPDKPLDEN